MNISFQRKDQVPSLSSYPLCLGSADLKDEISKSQTFNNDKENQRPQHNALSFPFPVDAKRAKIQHVLTPTASLEIEPSTIEAFLPNMSSSDVDLSLKASEAVTESSINTSSNTTIDSFHYPVIEPSLQCLCPPICDELIAKEEIQEHCISLNEGKNSHEISNSYYVASLSKSHSILNKEETLTKFHTFVSPSSINNSLNLDQPPLLDTLKTRNHHEMLKYIKSEGFLDTIDKTTNFTIESLNPTLPTYYYYTNFIMVVKFIIEKYVCTFIMDELSTINSILLAPFNSRLLFCRILFRKSPWFQQSKLVYTEIENILQAAKTLIDIGIFITPSHANDILPYLTKKELCNILHKPPYTKRQSLLTLASDLVKYQLTLDGTTIMCKLVRDRFKIRDDILQLFKRIYHLFYLNFGNYSYSRLNFLTLEQLQIVKYPLYIIPTDNSNSSNEDGLLDILETSFNLLSTSPDLVELTSKMVAMMDHPDLQEHDNMTALRRIGLNNIFRTRDHLLDYEQALDLFQQLIQIFQKEQSTGDKNSAYTSRPVINRKLLENPESFNNAMGIIGNVVTHYKQDLTNETYPDQLFLPFLVCFTSLSIKTTIIYIGVKILQYKKIYEVASEYLMLLLSQHQYKLEHRPHWWIRLTTNFKHLKRIPEAIDAASKGLLDVHCRQQHRVKLYNILSRLCKRKNIELKSVHPSQANAKSISPSQEGLDSLQESSGKLNGGFEQQSVSDPFTEGTQIEHSLKGLDQMSLDDIIRARQILPPMELYQCTTKVVFAPLYDTKRLKSKKSVFTDFSGMPCSVEEFSRQYYMNEGWTIVEHCEGSPFLMIFSLLFWDILFDVSVPLVFQTPFQSAPLDLTTDSFYPSRMIAIDKRCEDIYHSGSEDSSFAACLLETHYSTYERRKCIGVNWLKHDLSSLVEIVHCLGGPLLSVICKRLAMDYRFSHSGFPDLLLWDIGKSRIMLVEVKGPQDKLSENQRIWIDFLVRNQCRVELLYVKLSCGKAAEDIINAEPMEAIWSSITDTDDTVKIESEGDDDDGDTFEMYN